MKDTSSEKHKWKFKSHFRRNAFGWRSSKLAIQRVKQAVTEIKKVARKDSVLACEGAITFLERVSPALAHVDSSSGAIGTAVNHAIAELVPIISNAEVDLKLREKWLNRLFQAHADDGIPYIELLADYWGDMCASKILASKWSDDLIDITRMALSPDKNLRGHFHGAIACLSALYRAERYEEICDILKAETFWHYKLWSVKALAAMGKVKEAINEAESCRGKWTSDRTVDSFCEEILLREGHIEEAYKRYGLRANQCGTYLATFRSVTKKYPHKSPKQVLDDLVQTTPGEEGKWFAAAKGASLYNEAIDLVACSPCDPRTLIRAAKQYYESNPDFALRSGILALYWLSLDYGYEITGLDVREAYSYTIKAAEKCGSMIETIDQIREIVAKGKKDGILTRCLKNEL